MTSRTSTSAAADKLVEACRLLDEANERNERLKQAASERAMRLLRANAALTAEVDRLRAELDSERDQRIEEKAARARLIRTMRGVR